MNKSEAINTFYKNYNNLSDNKRNTFSNLVNKLLSVNYMCSSKNKDDYYSIVGDLDLYTSYFALMDYTLEYHQVDNVINIYNNQNYNRYNFKKNESIVLLILRKIYFQKMQEISLLEDITVTLEGLHEELMTTGIFDKRINKSELQAILRVLRRFNIIDSSDALDNDQSIIIIYPTICYVLPIERIEEIENRINDYTKRGEYNEEVSKNEND